MTRRNRRIADTWASALSDGLSAPANGVAATVSECGVGCPSVCALPDCELVLCVLVLCASETGAVADVEAFPLVIPLIELALKVDAPLLL